MSRVQLLLAIEVCLSLQAQTPVLERVLQAELAFARQADEEGISKAFRRWLVEEAKVFTPQMTTRKAQYGVDPGDPGHLVWYPEAMGASAVSDLAWSLGPWTYAPKKGDPILVHGHFLSLWRLQTNGSWRVVADIGVSHREPERPIEPYATWDAPRTSWQPTPTAQDPMPILRQKEADLARAWATQGGAVLLSELAQGARILRPGSPPLQGRADQLKALDREGVGDSWEPTLIQVSRSGDLAWTCGESGSESRGRAASFLRIWTLEAGTWKVLFDVRLPHPAPKK